MWEVGIGFLTGLMRRIHWVVHCLGGWQSRWRLGVPSNGIRRA